MKDTAKYPKRVSSPTRYAERDGDYIAPFEKGTKTMVSISRSSCSKFHSLRRHTVYASRPAGVLFNSRPTFMFFERADCGLALEKENALTDLPKVRAASSRLVREKGRSARSGPANIEHNAIHGLDADDTARSELSFLF